MHANKEKNISLYIFIASTNEQDNHWLTRQISALGHRVSISNDTTQTLDTFEKHLPDVVLIDAHIENSQGLKILQKMKQYIGEFHLPMLIMLKENDQAIMAQYAEHGADDFFFKPFNAVNLQVKLQTIAKQQAAWLVSSGKKKEEDQINQALLTLAERAGKGSEFYKDCVRTLAKCYACRYAFISLFLPDSHSRVKTLTVWAGDDFVENFEYDLQGTPCQDLLNCKRQLIPTNAAELYPDDHLLKELGVSSYFGARLLSEERGTLGLVAVMDSQPLSLKPWTEKLLNVFSTRISMELTHQMDVKDKTDTEKLQQHLDLLETSNQELKRFAEIASHTIQEPLRSIQAFSSLIEDDCKHVLPEQGLDYLDRIKKAAEFLQKQILIQLTFSRIVNNPVEVSAVHLDKVVQEILFKTKELIEKKQAVIDIGTLPIVYVDKKHILCLFENLFKNALTYQEGDKLPRINVYEEPHTEKDFTTICIEDNGIGLDMHYSDKIFEPHKRLHTQSEYAGAGLGLAICKRIVDFYLGKIEVQSEPGKGSIFKVNLPISNKIHDHTGA